MRADILTRSFLICTEALAIACLAILQCYAAPQDSTVPVRFAGRDQVLANWLPMIAQEEKYWEPEGVQVEYQTVVRGRDASQALVSGQSDITAMSEFSFMLALHHYDDLRLFGSIASSSNSVILIGDTSLGVHKITDIVGKRVALSVGSGSQFYVEDLLLQMGVKRDSIEILNLEPQALVSGAKRHEVPVMATWQPFSQQIETALGTNSVILREPSNIRPYQMSFVLVAREDFLRRNSAKLERFLAGLKRAQVFVREHRGEAIKIYSKRTGLSAETVDQMAQDYAFNLDLKCDTIRGTLKREDDWAKRSGLILEKFSDARWDVAIDLFVLKNPVE